MAQQSLIGMIRDGLLGQSQLDIGEGVEVMPVERIKPIPPNMDLSSEQSMNPYGQQSMAQEMSQPAMQDNINKPPQDLTLEDFVLDENKVIQFGVKPQELNEGLQAFKGVTHGIAMLNDINEKKSQGANTDKEESFFDQVASGVKKMFGNEEKMLGLALAFNTMRMTPDQTLASHLSNRLKTIRENKVSSIQAQQSIKQLMQMGETEAAEMIKANPKMYAEIMKQVAQKKFAKGASPTISGLQTDPNTGQQYVVRTNPATGKSERIDIEGAFGMTPEQKAGLENQQQERQFGIEQAQRKSEDVFTSLRVVDSQINNLNTMLSALDRGADTGIIRQYLPAFDEATSSLRAAANSLGIDVINSATFGALSATELELALRTAIDTTLPPAQLRDQITRKIAAQQKLREELRKDALMLTSGGVTFNQYLQSKLKTVKPKTSGNQQSETITPVQPIGESDVDAELKRRGLL
jgi:hypothetical protein